MNGIIVLIASIYAYILMSSVKKSTTKDGKLTKLEKIQVIITVFFSPIVAGAIYYYGWKKTLPQKANQANKYSLIIFLILIVLMFFIAFYSFSNK